MLLLYAEDMVVETNESVCAHVLLLYSHPVTHFYTYSQLTSGITGAVLILLYFKYCFKRVFYHKNLKILLFIYLAVSFVHNVLVATTKLYTIYRRIPREDPCDVYDTVSTCLPFRIPLNLCTVILVLTQISMVVERVVATCRLEVYERDGCALGAGLAFVVGIFSLVFTSVPYYHENLAELQTNCLGQSTATYDLANIIYRIMLTLDGLSILSFCFLWIYNQRKLKQRRHRSATYQTLENIYVSTYVSPLIVTNFVCFAIYIGGLLVLRSIRNTLDEVTYRLLTGLAFNIPYFTLLVPILLYFTQKSMEKNRKTHVTNIIEISKDKTIYFEKLRVQWQ